MQPPDPQATRPSAPSKRRAPEALPDDTSRAERGGVSTSFEPGTGGR